MAGKLSDSVRKKATASRQPGTDPAAAADSATNGKKAPVAVTIDTEARHIPLDQIVVMPGNPREDFNPAALKKLAGEIKQVGQIQPGCVRPLDNGEGFELFIGERRFRACKLAGLTTYRATVMKISKAEAIEMRGIENEEREDFNPIERAIFWQQMIDEAGYSQTKLAERFEVTQGEVSNTVRLLRLPKVWQQRVISQEILVSDARALIPWVEVAKVLDELDKEYRERQRKKWHLNLGNMLHEVINSHSRPMKGSLWDSETGRRIEIRFKPKADELEKLDIHTFDGEERAFDVRFWKQLQSADENKRKAAELKRVGKEADEKKGHKPTTEELKVKAEQFGRRIENYKHQWLSNAVYSRAIELSDGDLYRWLLSMALEGSFSFDTLKEIAVNAGMEPYQGDRYMSGDRYRWILAFDEARFIPVIRDLLRDWSALTPEGESDADEDAIDSLAGTLGIDIETDWKVDQRFLELHTIEQIESLERDWKILTPGKGKAGKIETILAVAASKSLAAPKYLVKPAKERK